MPYQTITLEIELRFYPLYSAYSFSCQFSNVSDGITSFQITYNIVILFFLLFNGLNASNRCSTLNGTTKAEYTVFERKTKT